MSLSVAELLRVRCDRSRWYGTVRSCQWCGKPLIGLDMKRRRTWCSERCLLAFERHHVWSHAKAAALAAADGRCSVPGCRAHGQTVEVVHLVPLGSAGYGMSCAHHAENLRVLCRTHKKQMLTTASTR